MTLVLAPALTDTPPWVVTLAPVDTVGELVELPVLIVALPPTAVAFPRLPSVAFPVVAETPAWTPAPVEAFPPFPAVAEAFPPWALAEDAVPVGGAGDVAETVALPPTAVAFPPLPPVAFPVVAETLAPTLTPVEALPPVPAVTAAVPPAAEPPT